MLDIERLVSTLKTCSSPRLILATQLEHRRRYFERRQAAVMCLLKFCNLFLP